MTPFTALALKLLLMLRGLGQKHLHTRTQKMGKMLCTIENRRRLLARQKTKEFCTNPDRPSGNRRWIFHLLNEGMIGHVLESGLTTQKPNLEIADVKDVAHQVT
jgi:hypothetical protein